MVLDFFHGTDCHECNILFRQAITIAIFPSVFLVIEIFGSVVGFNGLTIGLFLYREGPEFPSAQGGGPVENIIQEFHLYGLARKAPAGISG